MLVRGESYAGSVLFGAADGMPQLLGSALVSSSNGLVICDNRLPDLPMVYVNPAFERLTGYSAEQLLGCNARMLQAPDTDGPAVQVLHDAVRGGREVRVTLINARPDGSRWWNEMNLGLASE